MAPMIVGRIVCEGCANPYCIWCEVVDPYPYFNCVVGYYDHGLPCPHRECKGFVIQHHDDEGVIENFVSCNICKYRPAPENITHVFPVDEQVENAINELLANINDGNDGNDADDDDDDDDDGNDADDDDDGNDADDDDDGNDGNDIGEGKRILRAINRDLAAAMGQRIRQW